MHKIAGRVQSQDTLYTLVLLAADTNITCIIYHSMHIMSILHMHSHGKCQDDKNVIALS